MINLKNFTLYYPKDPPYQNALYLRAESGEDWYECQKYFKDDSLKVAYNSDGVIVSASIDVSGMFPAGLSVAEVSIGSTPELDIIIRGGWSYKNGNAVVITPSQEQ